METKELLGARYRLEHRLATGGMGDVWSARDELLGRRVALKLLHPHLAADEDFRRRFKGEAQAAARLSHPGVVGIFDYGEEAGAAFLAMELVDGEPLSSILRRRRALGPAETMSLVAQSADALAAAHREGLVHRDVKPGNLLVRPDGRVKVTDFGIVRANGVATVTRAGTVLGTVGYMSPEQVRGERVTAASDLYSLGVVAYECLTGERPFAAEDSISVALAHLHDQAPELPPGVPGGVRTLVAALLRKDPAERPASAEVVATSARRLAGARPGAAVTNGSRVATGRRDAAAAPGAPAPGTGGTGPPTDPLSAPGARDRPPTATETLDFADAAALEGLAHDQTATLAAPSIAPPVVLDPRRSPRSWLRVAAVAATALVVALLLSTAFSGGPDSARSASRTVAVPAVVGMTLQRAEHRLISDGLHTSTGPANPSPADVVVKETPVPGTRLRLGAAVKLTVTTPTATTPPTTTPTTTAPSPTTTSQDTGGGGPPGPNGTGPPGHHHH